MVVRWWWWIVAGMVLVGLEIVVPSFGVVWFGVAAFVVGGVVAWKSDVSVAAQLVVWVLGSLICFAAWFGWVNPCPRTMSREAVAELARAYIGLLVLLYLEW